MAFRHQPRGKQMTTFKATIKIVGLCGERINTHIIKAKTLKAATSKAWQIVGNQSGQVIEVVKS